MDFKERYEFWLKNADAEHLFSVKYNSLDTIHIFGNWANLKDKTDNAVIYSSFSFSFRNDTEYVNFQKVLSEIDIAARNRADEKY